jgi:hypothetical protein
MVVHRMPADGLIPRCLHPKALLRGYFFFCANISVMQFGRSRKDLWAIQKALPSWLYLEQETWDKNI